MEIIRIRVDTDKLEYRKRVNINETKMLVL